jgi:polyphenol oxidase
MSVRASAKTLQQPSHLEGANPLPSAEPCPYYHALISSKERVRLQYDLFQRGSDDVYRAESLSRLGWIEHGFGTRLSAAWPDHYQLGKGRLATAKQVHSNHVLVVQSEGKQGEGDALISCEPGIGLAIRTADCLPILIADPKNRAVAAVHAGWRGVVCEVAAKTVEAMTQHFGSRPEDLVVAIGPGIGMCCFEVGPEVAVQFGLSGRTKVDLVETTRRQLRRNGVSAGQICSSGLCTCCDHELFQSYRRDREAAGRMTAMIGVLKEKGR